MRARTKGRGRHVVGDAIRGDNVSQNFSDFQCQFTLSDTLAKRCTCSHLESLSKTEATFHASSVIAMNLH